MKKNALLLILLFVVATCSIFAQAQQPAQKPIILKPMVMAADLVFVMNTLNSIDITGGEVENFLACKTLIKETLQKAQDAKKTITDSMNLEIPLATAQNLAVYLERAKFSGNQAEQYKRFMEALVESTKPYRTPAQPK